jgi:hypothetical protein
VTTHVAAPGERDAACGQAEPGEPVLTAEQATDPDQAPFDCGACWLVLSGGAEPMGGSRP